MTTRRKHYAGTQTEFETGISSPKFVLPSVEAALADEKSTPATDSIDEKVRDQNIERLTALVQKMKANIAAYDARVKASEEQQATAIAETDEARKQSILNDLRRAFPGSDADFERLQDRLYDDHLAAETARTMAAPRPRI